MCLILYVFLGETLGTFAGPGKKGQVITITGSEPITGKYVVMQLEQNFQVLNFNEVKVMCAGKVLTIK